jgi:hypothetical protein
MSHSTKPGVEDVSLNTAEPQLETCLPSPASTLTEPPLRSPLHFSDQSRENSNPVDENGENSGLASYPSQPESAKGINENGSVGPRTQNATKPGPHDGVRKPSAPKAQDLAVAPESLPLSSVSGCDLPESSLVVSFTE